MNRTNFLYTENLTTNIMSVCGNKQIDLLSFVQCGSLFYHSNGSHTINNLAA
jgi:hypothetical protein